MNVGHFRFFSRVAAGEPGGAGQRGRGSDGTGWGECGEGAGGMDEEQGDGGHA